VRVKCCDGVYCTTNVGFSVKAGPGTSNLAVSSRQDTEPEVSGDRVTVHSRSANSGEEMENCLGRTLSLAFTGQARKMMNWFTIDSNLPPHVSLVESIPGVGSQ